MTDRSGTLPSTKSIVDEVFCAVKDYSKLAAGFPSDEHEYHMAFVGFRKHVREHSGVLLSLMDKCCRLLPKRRRVSLVPEDPSAPQLSEKQRMTAMEAIDSLLESVDTVLDNLKGQRINSEDQLYVTFGSKLGESTSVNVENGGFAHVAHVMRPQLTFEVPVDNSEAPFIPTYSDENGIMHTGEAHVHPFAEKIQKFSPSAEQLLPRLEIAPLPLSSCPLKFIDTVDELEQLVSNDLLGVKEIAVDLEHHDYYSYLGFTCLMQISTRTMDCIIDCLRLRSSMRLLAPVFLNPNILKVFHGAREDVRWLQKDFSLYLVNFFDTAIALQTLHMPHSLAFAVDHFCQVKLCKKYQTADWRVRPLPAALVDYARQDTHYLLYVYDRLRTLLGNAANRAALGNLLLHVYEQSKRLALEVYEKPRLDPEESYRAALGRSLGGLTAAQEEIARGLFNWRDAVARAVDDSPAAVLRSSAILAIASKRPGGARELLRCCNPVSATLRRRVAELVEIVRGGDGRGEEEGDAPTAEVLPSPSATPSLLGRPLGVFQPMTGTLPSIVSVVAPSISSIVGEGGGCLFAAWRRPIGRRRCVGLRRRWRVDRRRGFRSRAATCWRVCGPQRRPRPA
ncbi:unnamed protein product [Phytomonas sp. EM1]|nr:unnamed protein product [Phytomonas sp. EM1]|eukprot:CCW60707.1 unnamed protein product [Phytomonas sp. isolate EM1]